MILGGIGTYAEQLVKGLSKKGVEVHVIARGAETRSDGRIHRIRIPDVLYWRRLVFTGKAISLFHRLNKTYRFDLVHLNGTYPLIRSLGLPTVCTIHGPGNLKQMRMLLRLKKVASLNDVTFLFLKSPIGFLCDLSTSKVSDRIVCPSPSLVGDFSSRWDYLGGRQKMVVIPNGIDLEQFDHVESLSDEALANYGIEKDNYLLYMGRLSFLKGVDYLIEAFKMVQRAHPNLKLAIAGNGDFEPYLRKIARDMNRVKFLGFIGSIRLKKLIYEASLAVVLPSSAYETSSMVLLEAMSCSKPIIASDVGGNSYLIRHGENGFLSKPRDSENLANFTDILCENEILRKTMGINGRKLIEKEFTADLMVNRTLRTFYSLLN